MSDLLLLGLRWLVSVGHVAIVSSTVHAPLDISANSISAIRFSPSDPTAAVRQIAHPEDIERFVKFANRLHDRWLFPLMTLPSGEWSITLTIDGADVTCFWISSRMISGRDAEGNPVYCELSDDEWTDFEAILNAAETVHPDPWFQPVVAEIRPKPSVRQSIPEQAPQPSFPWLKTLGALVAGYLGAFVVGIFLVGAVERSERLIQLISFFFAPVFHSVRILNACIGACCQVSGRGR